MLTIAIASTKGGVGKTTTAASLGVRAARDSARVALVDLDPQKALVETDRHDQNEPSVQEPQQVQQDDDHDRNTCQPKYDVAEHNLPRLRDRSTGGWSKRKARGYALIAVVATLLGRPPGGSK
jgi:cellulose biosynthesis protein BcsQ